MKIELYHTDTCPSWKKALEVLNITLKKMKIDHKVEIILVRNQKEAEKYKFVGSPTIRIGGKDIDPMAKNFRKFSVTMCRTFYYNEKISDHPTEGMITDFLKSMSNA